MPVTPEPVRGLFIRDDDETLFSRDINGQLVRLDAPTESDYDKVVTVQIDGTPVTVPYAEPTKDAQGNIILDAAGRTTPRYTTIYDAAVRLYVKQPGDEEKIPIPTLCHQPHMTPVAVCRLCVVQIYGQKRGQRAAERKLLPACQHPVRDGMEVFTMNDPGPDGDRVRQTVKVVTEMLASDHLKSPCSNLEKELAPFNELGRVADLCSADATKFRAEPLSDPNRVVRPSPGNKRKTDLSSPVFAVDHTACILCDRCVRACGEVMENNVIGRTGKGPTAGIGFDLNDPMGESSCVQCGECMVSCPTSAISFKEAARVSPVQRSKNAEVLPAKVLLEDPIFAGVPSKFLLWQNGLVIRRRVKAGEVLCREGDAGNTAFILKSGKLEALAYAPAKKGLLGRSAGRGKPLLRRELTPEDLIVGEMACVTGMPRTADVVAVTDGEVWEIRRNVLDRLMRRPSLRERFESGYRERALDLVLRKAELFRAMDEKEYQRLVEFLRKRMTFVQVKPGQVIFEQGDRADAMFLVWIGFVRIGMRRYQDESRVLSVGPGSILGEIGLLAFTMQDRARTLDEADHAIKTALDSIAAGAEDPIPTGYRGATCSALGNLELARLERKDFLQMLHEFPVLRRRIVQESLSRLRSEDNPNPLLQDFIKQGLYEGESILLLDLQRCVRCDECTRGCAEQHGTHSHGVPVTRLFRSGERFDRFVVATSCRSCANAHCMVGCPVDSIHRGKHLQIVIEDHCIGCGLCASNCPYGSISMMPNMHRQIETPDPLVPNRMTHVAQMKATNCDLCDAEGHRDTPQPRCVSACPHDAAFRMSGDELMKLLKVSE